MAICLLVAVALKSSLILLAVVFIIAYILNPLIIKLQSKYNFKRSYISLIISLITLLLIVIAPILFIPMMVNQLQDVVTHIPDLMSFINGKVLANINAKLGTELIFDSNWIKTFLLSKNTSHKFNFQSILPIAKGGLEAISGIIDLIILPFVLFYVIKYWNNIVEFIYNLIPRRYIDTISKIVGDIDNSLSYYLRGQVLVILLMSVYYVITLNIAGLPAATITGVICGILVFIPYIGFSISVILALLLSLSQFEGLSQILILLGIFGVGCLIENFIATPFLIGDSIGLNPVMIIFALVICGNLFGLTGIIAALPLTAIGVVLLKHLYKMYLDSKYYNAHR